MDTRVFCVYNLARRVFLSSKVTVADGENQPLKVLKVMVSGLALDSESGLWLNPLKSTPSVPRLFPFDLMYLDQDHRVLEMVEVLPGVEFPPHRREIASAVVLPHDTLRSTQTRLGDHLVVCLREEADQLIPADPSSQGRMDSAEERPVLHAPAQIEQPETAAGQAASEIVPIVVDQGAVPEPTPTPVEVSIAKIDPEKPPTPANPPAIEPGDEAEGLFANWVESPSSTSVLIGGRLRPSAAEIDVAVQKALPSTAPAQSHAINGQEARFDTSYLPKAGTVAGERSETAGKVEQPAELESSSVRETLLPGPATELTAKPPTPEPRAETEVSEPMAGQMVGAGQEVSSSSQARGNNPVKLAIPQPSRTVSFTVAQYGMWQVSVPTAVTSRVVPPMKPGAEGAADRVSGEAEAPEVPMKKEALSQEAMTGPTAPEVVVKPIRKDREPESIAEAHTPLEKGDLRVTESATGLKGQIAAPVTGKIPDFEARLANVVSKAAPRWPIVLNKKEDPEPAPRLVQPPAPKVDTGKDWRTERIVEATGKPVTSEFAALVQEKLDRLQTKGNEDSVEHLAITPMPVIARKSDAGAKPGLGLVSKSSVPATAPPSAKRVGISARLRNWLGPASKLKRERRRADRRCIPGLVAHYFTGGAPKPYNVVDISMTGFYLLTRDRWTPDTMIRMTLQRPRTNDGKTQSITVLSRIVRRGSDGVAVEFVMPEALDRKSRDVMPTQATDRSALARFL